MDAINTETGEVIAENLTGNEVEALRSAGADVDVTEIQDEEPSGSGSDAGDQEVDEVVDMDAAEVSKDADMETKQEAHEGEGSDMDMDGSHLEWDGPDEEVDVEMADLDGFEDQYEQVQREEEEADTDLEQDRRERERRIEEGPVNPNDDYHEEVGHQTVRDHLNETGQADEIVEAFSQFKTDDRWVPDNDGERLNEDAVVDLVAGDTSAQDRLYERKEKAEPGDRAVAVSMDMSGSMRGVVKEAKSAMGALAIATREIGDDFVANGWTSTERSGKENQRITMVTGPDEDFDWEHLDALWPNHQDPITPGMRHAKSMCDDVSASERVMVVLTDGQPKMTADGAHSGTRATKEAKKEVRKLRDEGYVVIGIGIEPGADDRLMEKMFGEGGYMMSDEDSIADTLISIYESQMNVGGGR